VHFAHAQLDSRCVVHCIFQDFSRLLGPHFVRNSLLKRMHFAHAQLDSLRAYAAAEDAKQLQTAHDLRACIAQRLEVREPMPI
jgi:hypothetical protein